MLRAASSLLSSLRASFSGALSLRALILLLVVLIVGCSDDTATSTETYKDKPVTTDVVALPEPAAAVSSDSSPAVTGVDPIEPPNSVSTEFNLKWLDYHNRLPVVRDSAAGTVEIHGQVTAAGDLSLSELEQQIRVSDGTAKVSISKPEGEPLQLVISNITRANSCGQEVSVSWGEGNAKTQSFTIPSISGEGGTPLELISSAIVGDSDEVLELIFNRPLKKDQALKHLISSQYRFTRYKIDGSKLRLGLNNSNAEGLRLTIHKELQDQCGTRLAASLAKSFSIAPKKPGVRFTGSGVILPDAMRIELPFQAVSAKAVTVTAFEVFDNNVHQFLQENRLEEANSLDKVGRFIWQKSVPLEEGSLRSWQDYRLDITELMTQKSGSLIRLYISLDRGDSLIPCTVAENKQPVPPSRLPENSDELKYFDGYSSWNNFEPGTQNGGNLSACGDQYYERSADTKAAKNLLRSNIGIIVKQVPDAKNSHVVITDLKTSEPISGAVVEIFNFQGQSVGKAETDSDGFASVELSGKAFYLQAAAADQIGYIKLNDASALTTSQFDIGGTHLQSNIDGFIFGERDVWRPGDDIFLTFILKDKQNELPREHPVVADLFNPSGQLVESVYSNQPVGQLYNFTLSTPQSAPTGNWEAVLRVGGQDFHHPLRIETVVPNRLKVELDLAEGKSLQNGVEQSVGLVSKWLHGAPASSLKADVSVALVPVKTKFAGKFPEYVFDDPARDYRSNKINLFEGVLSKEGATSFNLLIESKTPPPGMLKALFTNRVFEESGQFSSNRFSRPFDYYDRYLGLQLPKGDAARGMLLTDEDHKTRLVVLDKTGQPVSNTNIDVSVYKLEWKWWYEKSNESLAHYADGRHSKVVASGSAVTDDNGLAEWPLRVNYPEWGRYLVRACIAGEDSHCTGKIVYIDWPGWAGRQQESQGDNVDRLTLFSDKETYQVGETATITLPELHNGRALVTVESANNLLQQFWVKSDGPNQQLQQQVALEIGKEMAPNVYVSVTYLQPHADRDNDRPMRLMGIIPLQVEDAQNHLHPKITTEDQVSSRASFDIQVAESDGRPMAYTLALVDEGLLGLTNYKAPDPFNYFYRRQALQVKTWDIYKDVVGAYSGELHGLLSVGGSDAQKDDDKSKKNRRFPPLVKFLGSFKLAAGEQRTHAVTLPMYLGAVRVMVIAEDGSAYGKAEHEIVVRDDISMFPTLPRVLRTQEQAQVPVELFNNTAELSTVQVTMTADDNPVQIAEPSQSVTLEPYSSAMVTFAIQTGDLVGKTAFTFETKSVTGNSSQTLYLDINAPNIQSTRTSSYLVNAESELDINLEPFGIAGSNGASVALSLFKPINLRSRLDYLIKYPHGCIEQTTSSVFPQLYLNQLSHLETQEQSKVQQNIIAAINRLQSFQTLEGGFSYWPGQSQSHDWGTSYAGHFLLLAKQAGYEVPEHLMHQWLAYQHQASEFAVDSTNNEKIKAQAYRLLTLSLYGKPNWSAMYRLKTLQIEDSASLAMLSLAYLYAGQDDVAMTLIGDGLSDKSTYDVNSPSFGSALRDKALFLILYANIAEPMEAATLADEIADQLADDRWHSTQTTAYALVALANYQQIYKQSKTDNHDDSVEVVLQQAGNKEKLQVSRQVKESMLQSGSDTAKQATIRNNGESPVWLTLTQTGIAKPGSEQTYAEGLQLNVRYLNNEGDEVDIARLPQGSNFTAQLQLSNKTQGEISNVALNFRAPSGWQIDNEREACTEAACQFDYIDIRDARASAYMGLKAGEQKTLSLQLNASFVGRYYLPAISASAMYNDNLKAQLKGLSVEVIQ
ncbi:MG2 domain-containing protein [Amphritea sp.]|uniref:alpha-2-macroglobulin family protein n=1 Tax=Amphritea sp. TaxID=1872502 RepID=UPI0025C3A198|nr:MG2 domain-containing protein [Amphritea sp.]